MRIAIVSMHAPPQPAVASHRILRMSRALIDAGHAVHWVTLEADRLQASDQTLQALIPDAVKVHGLGGPTLKSLPVAPNFIAKVRRTLAYKLPKRWPLFDGHFEWTGRLRRSLPRIVEAEGLDAVLLCCGPHGQLAVAGRLRQRFPELKIYADYRDLLSGNPWNDTLPESLRRRLKARERKALSHCDSLFLNTDDARARFLEVVGAIDGLPIEVMRNTADYELADDVFAADAPRSLGEGTHLGFFGTLYPQRRLREFTLALDTLSPEVRDTITLYVWCDARQSPPLLEEDLSGLDDATRARVVKHAFSPYGEALRSMRACDALALVNSPDERDVVFVPGKLFDYVMARRPVLFIGAHGDAADIVEATGGRAFAYGQTAEIAAALTELAGKATPTETQPNPSFAPAASFAPLLERLGSSAG